MLSERRDKAAARRFFKRAIGTNSMQDRVVIDKSSANLAGLKCVNVILKFTKSGNTIKILKIKYLNNIMEQNHRFIKRIMRPMLGFKALHSVDVTLAGIETAHMIRKGQHDAIGLTAFQQFGAFAALLRQHNGYLHSSRKFATEPYIWAKGATKSVFSDKPSRKWFGIVFIRFF